MVESGCLESSYPALKVGSGVRIPLSPVFAYAGYTLKCKHGFARLPPAYRSE